MDSLKRIDLLKDWLSKKLEVDFSISSASSDASFRKYFRIKTLEDSFIVMDAPPQNESIETFLKIRKILNKSNRNFAPCNICDVTGTFMGEKNSEYFN